MGGLRSGTSDCRGMSPEGVLSPTKLKSHLETPDTHVLSARRVLPTSRPAVLLPLRSGRARGKAE